MDKTVEQAKNVLVADLEDAPHVLEDPLGEGVTSRKIQDYVFACVTNGISKSDCVDWLYDLYHKQNRQSTLQVSIKDRLLGEYTL